jgi:hypothetical protein
MSVHALTTRSVPSQVSEVSTQPAGTADQLRNKRSEKRTSLKTDSIEAATGDDTRYLTIEEVSRAAEPVGEWMLNTEAWAPGTHVTAQFEIWISHLGVIEKWNLIGDSADDGAISKAFDTIWYTVMNPAMVNGTPMPSYRQLEIDIYRE